MKIRDRIYYGWIIVAVGLMVSAVLIGSRQSYGIFFKSIESEFVLNRAATSGIFSLFMLFSAVFAALGGWFLDRFGPKLTIATMGFFTGISLIITSQLHSVWHLFIAYSFLLAIGTGEAYTAVAGFVSRWFQKKRGLALGIATTGGGLGSLLIAPFASFLIISLDWRMAFLILGIIALVTVIGLSLLLKRSPAELGLLPDGIPPEEEKAITRTGKDDGFTGFTLIEAVRTRQFWLLFMIWLFHAIAVYIIATHIVPHATDRGFSELSAAAIISVLSLFNIAGALSVGALSDRFGRKAVAIGSALVGAGALFWLMWLPDNILLYYIFAALFGIPFGGMAAMVSALAGDIFGMRRIGAIMGTMGSSWFIGAAIGPLIGGIIFDTYCSYFIAFLVGALCMILMVIFLALLFNQRKQIIGQS